MSEVLVIGAGVIGLSSAILLADAGHHVAIWARELAANTISGGCGAYWFPDLDIPSSQALTWARQTYQHLEAVVMADKDSGVRHLPFMECFTAAAPDPWWRPAIVNYERISAVQLRRPYVDGYRGMSMLIDTSRYLPWLLRQLDDRNIAIQQRAVHSFDTALEEFTIVVNCTGLGARQLCHDNRVYPVRGQILIAEPADLDIAVGDARPDRLCYLIPRYDDLLIGGTTQAHNWNLKPDPNDTRRILQGAREILGRTKIRVLGTEVGLRPARDEVRLETENRNGRVLIHNYGHGSAGYSLSWGCAHHVVELADQAAESATGRI